MTMENNENIKPKRGRRSKKTIEEEKLNAEKNVTDVISFSLSDEINENSIINNDLIENNTQNVENVKYIVNENNINWCPRSWQRNPSFLLKGKI